MYIANIFHVFVNSLGMGKLPDEAILSKFQQIYWLSVHILLWSNNLEVLSSTLDSLLKIYNIVNFLENFACFLYGQH